MPDLKFPSRFSAINETLPTVPGELRIRLHFRDGTSKMVGIQLKSMEGLIVDPVEELTGLEIVDRSNLGASVACRVSRTHTVTEDLVRYIDGQIVGHCADCHERMVIHALPGGTPAVLADAAVEAAAAGGITAELALRMVDAEQQLLAERDAIEVALRRLAEARSIQRWRTDA